MSQFLTHKKWRLNTQYYKSYFGTINLHLSDHHELIIIIYSLIWISKRVVQLNFYIGLKDDAFTTQNRSLSFLYRISVDNNNWICTLTLKVVHSLLKNKSLSFLYRISVDSSKDLMSAFTQRHKQLYSEVKFPAKQ
jgi:hypothetical protein